ncbi:Extracellular ligand-binding receptor [Methylocella silvestris BL2]|uniref:Extracellular ligand-binding receptor n=1 Tax=Methylocella silvestris (strain DSM 15510 / CIP 108128 / LMG 27833 / NCIMB 13906 / BL2) TaxID=395965 RepID=B8EL55_METSB|nr:ABC transporter substrate-binding protein [Methylocella silvestris]ACK49050.1 Extracellular ligand-binding receptor [Methylocella silvestris BL2]
MILFRPILRCLLAAAFLASATFARAADPLTIGAIEILSGPNAKYGVAIKQGFDLGLDEINRGGGVRGVPLAIAYEDSAGSKEQAINAARQLIGRAKVPLLLGPTLSTEMFAVGPIANQRQTPIIGTSTTAIGVTDIGPFVFRTSLPEADVIPVTLRAARDKLGVKKVAVLYGRDDAFTKSAYDVMKAALAELGFEVLTTETFGAKDTDFSAQLTKIASLNPDAIVISALADAGAGILLAKQALGLPQTVRAIGGNGMNSPKVLEIAGPAADGLLVGSPWFVGKSDPLNAKFIEAYRAKYGSDPDQFAAQAYDTIKIAASALNEAKDLSGEAIRDALLKTKIEGVMGQFAFTPDRSPAVVSGVLVLEAAGGKFTILK